MPGLKLQNTWSTTLSIDDAQQTLRLFLEQNNMIIRSSDNNLFQAQQDVPIPVGEASGTTGSTQAFLKKVSIQLAPISGGTYIDATIEDISGGIDVSSEINGQRELFLKNWMWNLYTLLPAAQSAPSPVPPQVNPTPGYPTQIPPGQAYYPPGYMQPRPPKDRSLALILEIVLDLFGIFGIGWIYSGNTSTGVSWLIGVIIWDVVAVIIATITGGFGLFCTIPVNIILTAVSASSLNNYMKNHPELFGV